MFSRFNIGTRLGMALGTVSLLLVASVAVGLYGLNALKNTANEALHSDAAIAMNASLVQQLALQERRYEKDTFINIADADRVLSYHEKWQGARQQLEETLIEGESMATSAEARSLYQSAGVALDAYAAGFIDVYQRIRSGEITETAAANAAFNQYKDEVYRLTDLAEVIAQRSMAQVEEAGAVITEQYRGALVGLLGFAAIALLLAIVLAVTVTRSMIIPMRHALMITQHLAMGDLRQDIRADGRDEVGQLLTAMAEMSRSWSTLVISLRRSSDTVYIGANEISHGAQELSARTEQQASPSSRPPRAWRK